VNGWTDFHEILCGDYVIGASSKTIRSNFILWDHYDGIIHYPLCIHGNIITLFPQWPWMPLLHLLTFGILLVALMTSSPLMSACTHAVMLEWLEYVKKLMLANQQLLLILIAILYLYMIKEITLNSVCMEYGMKNTFGI
jgi:hypothetical protein